MTSTRTVQVCPPAIVPFEKVNDASPEAGEKVGVPQFVVLAFGGFATRIWPGKLGKLSVKETPVILGEPPGFGLLMAIVSVETPFTPIGSGEKDLLMVGYDKTHMEALAVLPVSPLVEVTALVVLFFCPAVVPVTLTVTSQCPPTATVPFEKESEVSPAKGEKVGVPQLVVVAMGGLATASPAGRLSVNATPVNATVLAGGLVMENVIVAVPLI